MHTAEVHLTRIASETVRVMMNNIGSLEDTLDGACFDIKLVIAKAISPVVAISISWCALKL